MNRLLHRCASPYSIRIKNLFGSAIVAYWPLDEASGLTAYDISGNNYNGSYTGPTLGQPGIGDGKTCPLFDGINDYVNIYSAGLANALNYEEITHMHWFRVPNAAIWTDATVRMAFQISVDANNSFDSAKDGNGLFYNEYKSGGGVWKGDSTAALNGSTTWHHFAGTVTHIGGKILWYIDGVKDATEQVPDNHWVGVPPATNMAIGSTNCVANFWSGYVAHMVLLNRVATPAEIAQAARR